MISAHLARDEMSSHQERQRIASQNEALTSFENGVMIPNIASAVAVRI